MASSCPQSALVRICRDFQKYIGPNNLPVYNIESKYAPTFHIHPILLASDFFARRKQLLKRIKCVVSEIETNDELLEYAEDEEISFMIHHFGIEQVIQKVDEIKVEKEKKEFDRLCKIEKEEINHENVSKELTIAINRRQRISFFEKLSKRPIISILWYLMCIGNFQRLKSKTNDEMVQVCRWMILLGNSLCDHVHEFLKFVHYESTSEIQKKMYYTKSMDKPMGYSNIGINTNKRHMIQMCEMLKSWKKIGINGIMVIANDYKHKGMKLLAETFFSYHDCKLCHYPHLHNLKNYKNFGVETITTGNVISSRFISSNHHYAKTIGVVKICITNDLIQRVNELVYLSTACVICKELLIALKMLRCARKLAAGYIHAHCEYGEEMVSDLNKTCWNQRCHYCKVKAVNHKHKACTGCMKVVYCSRECQKLDWNSKHRDQCNMSWHSIYGALKMTLFDRL